MCSLVTQFRKAADPAPPVVASDLRGSRGRALAQAEFGSSVWRMMVVRPEANQSGAPFP